MKKPKCRRVIDPPELWSQFIRNQNPDLACSFKNESYFASGQELRNNLTRKNLKIQALNSGFENYFYPMAWNLDFFLMEGRTREPNVGPWFYKDSEYDIRLFLAFMQFKKMAQKVIKMQVFRMSTIAVKILLFSPNFFTNHCCRT